MKKQIKDYINTMTYEALDVQLFMMDRKHIDYAYIKKTRDEKYLKEKGGKNGTN